MAKLRLPHTVETIGACGILLLCGGALVYLSRTWNVFQRGPMGMFATAMGPVAVILGIGMAIHGGAMPPTHITTVTRAWGILGSLASCAYLWSLGFFSAGAHSAGGAVRAVVPLAMVGVWFLPASYFGSKPADPPDVTGGRS